MFYPSPAQSSISHNPKYIKQHISGAPGDDEHVQHGKPKKQHRGKQRKRMSLKDIDECDLPDFDTHYVQRELTTVTETIDNNDFEPSHDTRVERYTTDCLISSLIEKAERLQNLVDSTKSRRKKKSGSKTAHHHEHDKSHIVYLPEVQIQDTVEEEEGATHFPPSAQPVSASFSESTRVLLPTDDVTVASLKDCFGQHYFEAACRPRRFVLDITSEVRDLLKKCGVQAAVADNTEDAFSYLIFIHDGFYDDELDVYKVFLNSRLRPGLLAVQINTKDHQDLYRGTVMNLISQTMDFVDKIVTDLMDQNHFPIFLARVRRNVMKRQLKHHLGTSEAYVPSVQRVFQRGSAVPVVTMPSLEEMLQEEPALCDVCYDDISPMTLDSASATTLMKCGHRVCDSCWSQHIHSRLHQGFVRVTCPGFDCQEEVNVGVLLSVATLDTVEKLLQRQEEVRIGSSETEKWCPNESCGRVIRFQPSCSSGKPEVQQDVLCACGALVCFQCLSPAHWPATCQQAEEYRTSLATTSFPDREAEVHDDRLSDEEAKQKRQQEKSQTMIVVGKHCPRCNNFVFKDGGCPQMTCRCGQMFCWYCTKPGYSHPTRIGCVNALQEMKLATTMVVRHLEADKSPAEQKKEQEQKSSNRRQRVSLMEKAAEHRQRHLDEQQHAKVITSLAKAVATAAAKDKNIAGHIIQICRSDSSTLCTSVDATQPPSFVPNSQRSPSVLEIATTFLKNVVRAKHELHEVAEYSLVLLKDLPDSLLRRRALRISEDLGAFCTFTQSIFDACSTSLGQGHLQEAVKSVTRLAEIQGWINSALATHVVTVKKLRNVTSAKQ